MPSWDELTKYVSKDLLDTIGTKGSKIMRNPQYQNIPPQRWMTQVVKSGPCHIFWKKWVSSFEAIAPRANAFPYNSFMYDGDGWHRCSAVGPAPKAKIWKPILESEVPVELRTKLLLLS